MPASIYDLPPETLALILLHAQAHDQHAVATQYSRTHQQHVKPADYQQRQQRHAHLALNSALQLSRTSRAFYDASLAVHYHVRYSLFMLRLSQRVAIVSTCFTQL